MNEETLIDRLEGPPTYMLADGTVVHVIPPSGIAWNAPDGRHAFERVPADDRLTAADVRSVYASPGPLLPPSDVRGSSFIACATCANTRPTERCSGCPRGTASSRLIERIRKCLA